MYQKQNIFLEMGEAKIRDPALLVLLQLQDW